MIVKPDSLEHLVLYQADDDWLPIGTANFYAGFFEEDLTMRKALVLDVLRALGESGYVQIGRFATVDDEDPESRGWVAATGTLEQQLDHVSAVYSPELDDFDWYWNAAMNITPSGREALEGLPEPDGRFFDWAKRRKS